MIVQGDALMLPLPDRLVQCVVTSPPYWGLRKYAGQQEFLWDDDPGCDHEWAGSRCARCPAWIGALGLEPTPDLYVSHLVQVFREVRRVLRDDGTVWLNLGDSYNQNYRGGGRDTTAEKQLSNTGTQDFLRRAKNTDSGVRNKDLVGIPWRVALALQQDGWYLRSDIIWAKPNPMPESVTDRPTRSHEYVFLLTMRERYYYDHEAIKETAQKRSPWSDKSVKQGQTGEAANTTSHGRRYVGFNARYVAALTNSTAPTTRNARSVWTITPKPYRDAHFATFPPELPTRCIKAGSKPGDYVLDPFGGSGTVALVARDLDRRGIAVDLSHAYCRMGLARLA